MTDILEVHFIDLEKLRKGKGIENVKVSLMRWLRFLASKSKEELEMLARSDNELNGAYEDLKKMSADDKLRLQYEARQAWLMDERSRLKQERKEGKEEGREEGKEEERLVIAKNALKKGLDKILVAELTGLSDNEIDKLTQEINK